MNKTIYFVAYVTLMIADAAVELIFNLGWWASGALVLGTLVPLMVADTLVRRARKRASADASGSGSAHEQGQAETPAKI